MTSTDSSVPVLPAEVPVSFDDILAARDVISAVAVETGMEHSRALGRMTGATVHLKCENLQRAGSFKVRGAYNRMYHIPEEDKGNGVVAASAGNHAQGVALAASKLGLRATIFMPLGAALPKVQATKDHGAEVVLLGNNVDEALAAAKDHAAKTGQRLFIPSTTRRSWQGKELLDSKFSSNNPMSTR